MKDLSPPTALLADMRTHLDRNNSVRLGKTVMALLLAMEKIEQGRPSFWRLQVQLIEQNHPTFSHKTFH
jgi:hypothetical protein